MECKLSNMVWKHIICINIATIFIQYFSYIILLRKNILWCDFDYINAKNNIENIIKNLNSCFVFILSISLGKLARWFWFWLQPPFKGYFIEFSMLKNTNHKNKLSCKHSSLPVMCFNQAIHRITILTSLCISMFY